MLTMPAATMAAYSPRECPAAPSKVNPAFSMALMATRLVEKMAGWLILVWARVAASASRQSCFKSMPVMSLPHW